jgi:hypothetical protein
MADRADWPYSQLLGRALVADDLEQDGPYMTIEVGGELDGIVALSADSDSERVSVSTQWGPEGARRELRSGELELSRAEQIAARWADELGAGIEPEPAQPADV